MVDDSSALRKKLSDYLDSLDVGTEVTATQLRVRFSKESTLYTYTSQYISRALSKRDDFEVVDHRRNRKVYRKIHTSPQRGDVQ